MKTRIKEARKALGLSREKFAEGLGLKSRGKIVNVENGTVEPDDAFIRLICQVYRISYEWLTTGQGEMFSAPGNRDEEISKFIGEALADESGGFKAQLLHVLSRLTDEEWEALADVAEMLREARSGPDPPE